MGKKKVDIRISSTLSTTVVVLASLWLIGVVPATFSCPSNCTLPDCQCASKEIPGGLRRDQIPQMVTITLDGAIRVQDYEMFYSKVLQGRKNPNGCDLPLTFFVSHDNTDYSLATKLANDGHELAVHSVTRRLPSTFWSEDRNNTEELTREILDMRELLSRWARVPKSNVVGYRSPFLASSVNQLKILHENDFLYDSTMVTNEMYWPFTLDYKSPICSSSAVCPEESLPGLWVIPNINKVQNSSTICTLIDTCAHPPKSTKEEWMNFFMDNFERHYNSSKAPFGLYASSLWFLAHNSTQRLQAFMDFLDYLGSLEDVYIVTMSQLIAWSRNPTRLGQLRTIELWQCPSNPPTNCTYTDPNICTYFLNNTEYIIRLCKDDVCSQEYPNITNPQGVNTTLTSTSVPFEVLSTSIAPTGHLPESSHLSIPGSPTSSGNIYNSHTSIDPTNSVLTILPTSVTTLNTYATAPSISMTTLSTFVTDPPTSVTTSSTSPTIPTISESVTAPTTSIVTPSTSRTAPPISMTAPPTSVIILPMLSRVQSTAIHTSQALVSSESMSTTASLSIDALSADADPGVIAGLSTVAVITAGIILLAVLNVGAVLMYMKWKQLHSLAPTNPTSELGLSYVNPSSHPTQG